MKSRRQGGSDANVRCLYAPGVDDDANVDSALIWNWDNIGTVKEGERVIYKRVPWEVSSLGLFTVLSNPELSGGEISLPLAKLADMNSRACHSDKP